MQAQFDGVIDQVHDTDERVIVMRDGQAVVAILSVDVLESLEETVAILQNDKALRDLEQADREAAGGTLGEADLRALVAGSTPSGA